MFQPRRWLFALPIPVALLLTFIIWFLRGAVNAHNLYGVVCLGSIFFPIGLFAPFIWAPAVFEHHAEKMFVVGWTLYLWLMVLGFNKPNRVLFWVLCGLLLLNVGGCHLSHIEGVFRNIPV